MIAILPAAAAVIPVDLPPPDARPPAKKPVKVYIQSGQSNSLGFGAVKPGAPMYSNIFLTADPSVQPAALPVGKAALLKHGVHDAKAAVYAGAYDPKADYSKVKPAKQETVALGSTSATLPSIDGPHTVVVTAFIDVPYDGNYELHAGFESSSHAIAELDGKEVYRKETGAPGHDHQGHAEKRPTLPAAHHLPAGRLGRVLAANRWISRASATSAGSSMNWAVSAHLARRGRLLVKRPDVYLNDAYMGKGSSAPHGVDACRSHLRPRTRLRIRHGHLPRRAGHRHESRHRQPQPRLGHPAARQRTLYLRGQGTTPATRKCSTPMAR